MIANTFMVGHILWVYMREVKGISAKDVLTLGHTYTQELTIFVIS